MVSIQQKRIEATQEFLDRYRRVYLASVCKEMSIGTDLRVAALAEARAMIELAASLTPVFLPQTGGAAQQRTNLHDSA
jgi:hypothetical protein